MTVNNFKAIAIFMAVLVRTKLAATVKKDFFQITDLLLNVEICSFCMYFTFEWGTLFCRNVKNV